MDVQIYNCIQNGACPKNINNRLTVRFCFSKRQIIVSENDICYPCVKGRAWQKGSSDGMEKCHRRALQEKTAGGTVGSL